MTPFRAISHFAVSIHSLVPSQILRLSTFGTNGNTHRKPLLIRRRVGWSVGNPDFPYLFASGEAGRAGFMLFPFDEKHVVTTHRRLNGLF